MYSAYHFWLIIVPAASVVLAGLFVYIRYPRKRRKTGTCEQEIIDLLKDAQRISLHQYTNAKQLLPALSKTRNNVPDSFLSGLSLPLGISQPASFLLNHLVSVEGKTRGKVGTKLFRLRDEIRYQYSSLQEQVQHYKATYRSNESSYYENIAELSKIHDELGRYVSNKNIDKLSGSEWYENYFTIFGTWFRNGANQDIETTYNEIVLKIAALNKLYRFVPFVIPTTACTANCVIAYKNIVDLNNILEAKVLQYAYGYRLSYKTVRLILQQISPLPVKQMPVAPVTASPDCNEADIQNRSGNSGGRVTRTGKAFKFSFLLISCAVITGVMLTAYYILSSAPRHRQAKADTSTRAIISPASTQPDVASSSASSVPAGQPDKTDTLSGVADFKILYDSSNNPAPSVYGIDVSRYQGTLMKDLESFDTLHFVICKATEGGSYVDNDFRINWPIIKQKGLIRGAYHFFHSEDPPVKQAQLFLQTTNKLSNTDLPPIVDVEETSIRSKITPYQLDSSLLIFLQYIKEKTNRTPIIYSDVAFANRYLVVDALAQYHLWLAEYNKKTVPDVPRLWKNKGYIIWQRSASYDIDARVADFDIFNGNGSAFAKFIRNN